MSETINGSKSSNYIKDQVPGIDNSSDSLTHQSVQNLWNGRGAADVLIHGLYKPSVVAMAIEAGSVRRKLVITAHGAREGDFVRITSGAASGEEVAIVKVVDANTIVIAKEVNVSITDSIEIWRAITPAYNSDGSLNVAVTPSPVAYNRKSAGITSAVNVLEDLDTPSSSRPLPVAIHSIDGAGITVNAGDLSVSISHVNDSVAIGDGATLVGVTVANELKVHDADLLAELQLKADLTETQPVSLASVPLPTGAATSANQATEITALGSLLTELQLKADLSETQPVSLASVPLPTGAATSAKQDLLLAELQLKADLTETQPVSIAGTVAVSSTDLDIRDLVFATDKVDASGSSVTANIGTTNGLALDATLTGGSAVSIVKGGAKGATVEGVLTSTAQSVDRQALDVQIRTSAGVVVDTFAGIGPTRSKVNLLFNDYSSTSVTTASYVQLIASTAATSTKLEIFDSSGEVLILAVGAAASEVDQLYIFPGGNGPVELNIPSGSRISVKAKTTTASAGLLVINLYS